MAEEESGFTFVDKRRTASEEASSATSDQSPQAFSAFEESADDADVSDADFAADEGEAPSVYGIIGYCISLLATEAWQKLGLLADPQTGEAVADLSQAKAAIDAVGDLAARLEAAPSEAVPDTLRRDLRTLLNDLRLNYVSRRGDTSASRN